MNCKGLKTAPFLIAVIVFLALASPALPLTVEGVGVAASRNVAATDARDVALWNALKSAVANAAKKIDPVSNKNIVERLQKENYTSYIKSYKIIYELSTREEYKVIIEAEIDSLKLKNRLKGLKYASPLSSKGKQGVSIRMIVDAGENSGFPTAAIRDEIASVFRKRGFEVKGAGDGSGIVITAKIKTKSKKTGVNGGKHLYHSLVTLALSAEGADGQTLAESRKSTYELRSESAIPTTTKIKQIAKAASREIVAKLEKRITIRRSFSSPTLLTFSGLTSYLEYEKLDSMLSNSLLGIDSVMQRTLGSDRVEFEVALNMAPGEFAQILNGLEIGGHSLYLEAIYPGRIEYRLIPQYP